jgi:two-component system cell cycle response regulator DivK
MAARSHTLLVVEDDVLNLELLTAVLEAAGFTVHTADNGRTALEVARRVRPDAVLMDIQMPEMDGLEATRALHAMPGCDRLPVIAVTAHVKKEDEERSREAGCVRHVPKPVDTRALPGIVREVIAPAGGAPATVAAAGKTRSK